MKQILLPESWEKYAQICLQVKTVPKQYKTNMLVDYYVKGQQGIDYFTGSSVIMNYGLVFWQEVKF